MDYKEHFGTRFEKREPLNALDLWEMDDSLRAHLLRIFQDSHVSHGHEAARLWAQVLIDYHLKILHEHKNFATYNTLDPIQNIFEREDSATVLGFIEFSLRHRSVPRIFVQKIRRLFNHPRIAWNIETQEDILTLVPAASVEEGAAIQTAYEETLESGMSGAQRHLALANENFKEGDFPSSIRESIHAIESTCIRVAGTGATLGDALRELRKLPDMNAQLLTAFDKLYAFTNSERGIRHSLLDEPEKISEDEALFMLGASASFVTYLIRKSRKLEK